MSNEIQKKKQQIDELLKEEKYEESATAILGEKGSPEDISGRKIFGSINVMQHEELANHLRNTLAPSANTRKNKM